jgi:hypothetical protein
MRQQIARTLLKAAGAPAPRRALSALQVYPEEVVLPYRFYAHAHELCLSTALQIALAPAPVAIAPSRTSEEAVAIAGSLCSIPSKCPEPI